MIEDQEIEEQKVEEQEIEEQVGRNRRLSKKRLRNRGGIETEGRGKED